MEDVFLMNEELLSRIVKDVEVLMSEDLHSVKGANGLMRACACCCMESNGGGQTTDNKP